jgi:uncharacterized protein YmfQ (DUF2313 family)
VRRFPSALAVTALYRDFHRKVTHSACATDTFAFTAASAAIAAVDSKETAMSDQIIMPKIRSILNHFERLLTLTGVGVEKVTSISRIRFNRGVLEEGIRPCSV